MRLIKSESGNALINVDHIVRIYIDPPAFEAKKHRVIATLTYGCALLHSGTEASCKAFLAQFLNDINDGK